MRMCLPPRPLSLLVSPVPPSSPWGEGGWEGGRLELLLLKGSDYTAESVPHAVKTPFQAKLGGGWVFATVTAEVGPGR
jgi:hypothetical protein